MSGSYDTSDVISTSDNVTDYWNQRRNAGEIINNDYFSQTTIIGASAPQPYKNYQVDSSGSVRADWTGTRSPYTWCESFLDLPNIDIQSLKDQAVSGAHAKISDPEALLGVTIAEAHKTFGLVSSILRKLNYSCTSFIQAKRHLKRKFGSGAKFTAELAQLWLEYRYGIRPLIYEIKGIAEGIAQEGKLRRYSHTYTTSDTQGDDDLYTRGSATDEIPITRIASNSVSVRAGVTIDLEGRSTKSYSDTLGGDDILSTAWELVPFSFVVDWFLNTSNFIASWEPTQPRVMGSFVSLQAREYQYNRAGLPTNLMTSRPLNAVDKTPYITHEFEIGDPWISLLNTYREREANPSKPIIPSLNIRLDTSKIADIVALIRGNASRLRV